MTTQVGTFIPLQPQNSGFGANQFNQNNSWGLTGWNPNPALLSAAGWNLNHSHNPSQTTLLVVPAYGTNVSEFGQGFGTNGTQVAFIPQTSGFSGSSYLPGNTIVQGITSGAPVVGVSGTVHNGQQNVTGICQSLATELSENNNEYIISFDVPGIEIQDLDISLAGNTIWVNGIRKGANDVSSLTYSEIARGSLSRSIAVPFDISPTKAINTSLDNGVLKIRIAKENQSERKATTRKVKIG